MNDSTMADGDRPKPAMSSEHAAAPCVTDPWHRPHLLLALLVTGLLLLIKGQFEHTACGRRLEEWTYGILQYQLFVTGCDREKSDAIVINLDRPKERWEKDGRSDVTTPREPLIKLLELLAAQGARGVAIDVDFSPDNGLLMHPDDRTFFLFCLELSRKANMPIALGVWRTRLQPYNWLISDEFQSLAGAYDILKAHPERCVRWIKATGARVRLPSLAARITDTDDADVRDDSLALLVRSTSKMDYPNVRYSAAYSPIDFSHLPLLRQEALPTQDPCAVGYYSDKIRGRYVLLGKTNPTSADDWFEVPELGRVPGVFLHACAAVTFAGQALYTLTSTGRVLLDILIALLIFCGVTVVCLVHRRFAPAGFLPNQTQAQYLFTGLAVVIVSVVSILFVRRTRLLWTDFILVCIVLALHPVFDGLLHRIAQHLPTWPLRKHNHKNPP